MLSANRILDLGARELTNTAAGVLSAARVSATVTGEFRNDGLVNATSQVLGVQAARVHNRGRLYGDAVAVRAAELVNDAGAVIASRGADVAIDAAVRNTGQALIHSARDLVLSREVTNIGSILTAERHVGILGELQNLNAGLATAQQTREEPRHEVYITPRDRTERFAKGELAWIDKDGGYFVLPSAKYPLADFGAVGIAPATECMQAHTDAGDSTCRYHYTPQDPVWSRFDVAAPVPPAPLPSACSVHSGGDGGQWERVTQGECAAHWSAHDDYQRSLPEAYARLDEAIASFNQDVYHLSLIHISEPTRPY